MTSLRDHSVSGVTAGEYKVVLMRNVPLPEDLQFNSQGTTLPETKQKAKAEKHNAFIEKNNVIPKKLQSNGTNPIDLTVEGKFVRLTIDISKY
ncbi:MAG: hypothetical protein LBT05_02550 [Planctomycetaceae bacterium]|jgi:hypothetical protein|nr:hypothetical protein [Planctomycetaceae bacterium]